MSTTADPQPDPQPPGPLILVRSYDHPDAVALVELIQQYYVRVYGGPDQDRPDPAEFAPPRGLFLVAYRDGVPVACGGWRRRADVTDAVEIKRMFVADSQRRTGLARRLLAELERAAAQAGAARVVLNTGYRQPEAMRLYETSGYRSTDERFGHYEQMPGSHFYVKQLSPVEAEAGQLSPGR